MKFSLRLSFYLRHSLRGYIMGTTAGFPVKIMEALAPQSHRQITRRCPPPHTSTHSASRQEDAFKMHGQQKARGLLLGSCTPDTTGHWLQPKILDMTGSLRWQTTREPYTLGQVWPHDSMLKKRGYQPKTN
jgi:hypothetical protein